MPPNRFCILEEGLRHISIFSQFLLRYHTLFIAPLQVLK